MDVFHYVMSMINEEGFQSVAEACDVYIDLTQITAHAVAARHPGCIEKGKGGSVKWKPKSTTHA